MVPRDLKYLVRSLCPLFVQVYELTKQKRFHSQGQMEHTGSLDGSLGQQHHTVSQLCSRCMKTRPSKQYSLLPRPIKSALSDRCMKWCGWLGNEATSGKELAAPPGVKNGKSCIFNEPTLSQLKSACFPFP